MLSINKNSYPSVNTVQSFGVHRIEPYGPRGEKTCLRGFANNKGADHPAQSDQHLCYSLYATYHKQNFKFPANLFSLGDWFVPCYVGKDKDRLCRATAHILSESCYKWIF